MSNMYLSMNTCGNIVQNSSWKSLTHGLTKCDKIPLYDKNNKGYFMTLQLREQGHIMTIPLSAKLQIQSELQNLIDQLNRSGHYKKYITKPKDLGQHPDAL